MKFKAILHLGCLGLLACLGIAGEASAQDENPAGPNVLILQSLDSQSSPYDEPTRVFRLKLQEKYNQPVSFAEVGLEARWGGKRDREPYQLQLLQNRFHSQPPDLVAAIGPSAIDFWQRYRDKISSEVPSILVARETMVTAEMLRMRDAGIASQFSFTHVVDDIVDLIPETEHIVIVFGASELERALTAAAREDLARFGDRIRFTYTSDMRVAEIEGLVSELPRNSAVWVGIFTIDTAGLILPFDSGIKRLIQASSAPVFGIFDHELGDGIVGGRLIPTRVMGGLMAEAAYLQFSGELTEPDFHLVPLSDPVYDWRALKKWNIDSRRLPAGSHILFEPPEIWPEYGPWLLLISAALLAQTVLITALLINRRRWRQAESASARLSGRLITAHEDERWRIARELHDDLSQRLAGLAIDAGFLARGPGSRGYDDAMANMQPELVRISKDVHDMSYRLHPSMVGDLGLATALRTEIDRVRRRTGCRVELEIEGLEETLSGELAMCLYRIAQEALNNAIKYANATLIRVSLLCDYEWVVLEVRDDGQGFDLRDLEQELGIGVSGMRERARLAGGTLELRTSHGSGTTITAKVPLRGSMKRVEK